METQREVSRSVFETIEEIKSKYRKSKKVQYLNDTDSMMKKTHRMEGRELSEWNANHYGKCRRIFDRIVRDVCKRHGRNENHIRRIAGWKRGKNIINLNFKDNE